MIWKTDWGPGDNYAAEGTAHFDRLLANLGQLRELIRDKLFIEIPWEDIQTSGFSTWPFADLLMRVERNIEALHVLNTNWILWNGQWKPGAPLPGWYDINRWERNGKAAEDALHGMESAFRHSGTFTSGTEGLRA